MEPEYDDRDGAFRFFSCHPERGVEEVLRLSSLGAWVRGEQVSDSGDVWRAFREWVRDGMALPGTPRRLKDAAVRALADTEIPPDWSDVEGRDFPQFFHDQFPTVWAQKRELAETVATLAREVLRLRTELRRAYANNAERNRMLEALMWQWCGAACEDGRHAYRHRLPLTEGLVRLVEESAAGLRLRWGRAEERRLSGAKAFCESCGQIVLGQHHDCAGTP